MYYQTRLEITGKQQLPYINIKDISIKLQDIKDSYITIHTTSTGVLLDNTFHQILHYADIIPRIQILDDSTARVKPRYIPIVHIHTLEFARIQNYLINNNIVVSLYRSNDCELIIIDPFAYKPSKYENIITITLEDGSQLSLSQFLTLLRMSATTNASSTELIAYFRRSDLGVVTPQTILYTGAFEYQETRYTKEPNFRFLIS